MKFSNILIAMWATTLATIVNAADIEQGKSKAALCAGCHGNNGISLTNDTPNLAGQKPAYLVKQLKAFKDGSRNNPTMQAMTMTLSDNDMDNIAGYYGQLSSSQAPAKAMTTNTSMTGDKASAKEFPATTFISMKGSASIASFPQEKFAAGGPNMLYTAITPNGKMVLSTSPSTGSVYVFDSTTLKQLAIIKVGKAPKGVKVSPDGKVAYISNQGSNDISVVDLMSLKNVATIKTEAGPHNARFTKDGSIAYVTLQGGAGIGVIDTKKRKMVKVIKVPGITGPHNLDLSKDEKIAFVRDFVQHVAVVDLVQEKVIKVLTVGKGHGGIDVAPNGKFAATAAIGDDIISVIDTKSLAVKNIKVGKGPHGIKASKNSQWLYVTLTGENKIAVINTNTMTVTKKIAVEKFPFWIAVQGNP